MLRVHYYNTRGCQHESLGLLTQNHNFFHLTSPEVSVRQNSGRKVDIWVRSNDSFFSLCLSSISTFPKSHFTSSPPSWFSKSKLTLEVSAMNFLTGDTVTCMNEQLLHFCAGTPHRKMGENKTAFQGYHLTKCMKMYECLNYTLHTNTSISIQSCWHLSPVPPKADVHCLVF